MVGESIPPVLVKTQSISELRKGHLQRDGWNRGFFDEDLSKSLSQATEIQNHLNGSPKRSLVPCFYETDFEPRSVRFPNIAELAGINDQKFSAAPARSANPPSERTRRQINAAADIYGPIHSHSSVHQRECHTASQDRTQVVCSLSPFPRCTDRPPERYHPRKPRPHRRCTLIDKVEGGHQHLNNAVHIQRDRHAVTLRAE